MDPSALAGIPGLPQLLAGSAFMVKAVPYIVAGFFYGQVVSHGYGFVKLVYQRVQKRPLPANRVTKALDALNKLLPNALGFFNVVLPWFGRPALFIPPVPDFARWLPADENTPAPPGLVVLPPEPQPLPIPSDDTPPASDVPAGNPPAPETDA